MRLSLYDWCIRNQKEYLLEEWSDKNLPLTPKDISYGSKEKPWWVCEHGHEWQAAVYTRTSGSGCPYCTGRRVDCGRNDIKTRFPELAKEFHPTKNGNLTLDQLSIGSHKKVWWRCSEGHEWQAVVKSRVSGVGCPVCANKLVISGVNDFSTTYPDLAKQWDGEKNAPLLPSQVPAGSSRRVWWRCENGHKWKASIASRVNGNGCPVCAGKVVVAGENDLASAFPNIAAELHPTKNGVLTARDCTPASNRKVWWLCPLGHEYQAAVGARTVNGSSCPYCAGRKVLKGFNDLATLEPKIAAQWHPTLNGTLTPDMVTVGSARKVWWQCGEGHVWKAVIHSRTGKKKCGCPVCAGRIKPSRQTRYAAILKDGAAKMGVSDV